MIACFFVFVFVFVFVFCFLQYTGIEMVNILKSIIRDLCRAGSVDCFQQSPNGSIDLV